VRLVVEWELLGDEAVEVLHGLLQLFAQLLDQPPRGYQLPTPKRPQQLGALLEQCVHPAVHLPVLAQSLPHLSVVSYG